MFERLKELSYVKEMKLKEPIISYELSEDFHNKKFEVEDFKDQVYLESTYVRTNI